MVEEIRDSQFELAERLALVERQRDLLQSEFDAFSGAISHDMRGPLQVQKGLLSLLQSHHSERLDTQTLKFLNLIDQSADRLDAMVCGLVEWSRVGRARAAPAPIDCAAFVVACQFDLRERLLAIGGELKWGPLPQSICGDANQLRRVIVLLVDNAMVHHGPGVVHVEIQVASTPTGWLVTVADDGQGMDAADAERIFAPFQRLNHGAESIAAGMGLTICQRIIRHHGGELIVETSPGAGARFSFNLPLQPPPTLHI